MTNQINKQKGNVLPIVIFAVIALVGGGIAGYLYGSKPTNLANPTSIIGSKTTSQKLIDEPIGKWGTLVNKAYARFEVEGTVVSIKDGVGGPTERQGPGKLITLKNGANTATYFVQASSDWWEGSKDKKPWKAIEDHDIKPGDKLTIQMHVPISEDAQPEQSFGFSVLRNI